MTKVLEIKPKAAAIWRRSLASLSRPSSSDLIKQDYRHQRPRLTQYPHGGLSTPLGPDQIRLLDTRINIDLVLVDHLLWEADDREHVGLAIYTVPKALCEAERVWEA